MVDIRAKLATGLEQITGALLGTKVAMHVQNLDEDGNPIPVGSPTDPVNVEALLKDSTGNEIDLSNLEIILPTPLKADRIPSITTDGGNVAQTGILAADLYNSGNTTITVWFGEAPGAGKSIYLNSGQRWTGYIDDQSGMYYDSDAAGGQLDYVLRG